jgi:hypothetical protein
MLKKRKILLTIAIGMALSGSAWATAAWIGNQKYMGQPPGYEPNAQQVNIPSGVSTGHGCTPIGQGGGCWATYNGNLASSADIRALNQQVYDLQLQMAKDISWLGYYTARAVKDGMTAQSETHLMDEEQVPSTMPCGADSCTAQVDMASATAGGSGAFGVKSPVSGVPMVDKQAKEGLLTKKTTNIIASSYAVHNQYFCSSTEKAAGMCEGSISPTPNQDILGTTLLSSHGINPPAHPQHDAIARTAFVQNITDQIPVPAINPKAYKTPEGQLAVGAKLQYMAQQSLAETALDQIAAMHEPYTGMGTVLNQTIKGLGMPAAPANISMLQYLSYMQKAQFGNVKWYISLAKDSNTALLREMAIMQAEQLQMQYIAMRQRMAMEAMEASNYATNAQARYASVAEHLNNSVGAISTGN